MALPWLLNSRSKGVTGISCRTWLVQGFLFLCLSTLQELKHQQWSKAFAFEEALLNDESKAVHIAGKAGVAGVTAAEVSTGAPTSSDDGSVFGREGRDSHTQEQRGRESERRWFIGASNKNAGDHDLPRTAQDWIPNGLPSELAADSNAIVKRPTEPPSAEIAFKGLLFSLEGDMQGHALAAALGSALASMFPESHPTQRDGAHESLRLVGTWATNSVELLLADFGG
ncbi:hypothetical protein Emag_000815 [Eimeria magna]